MIKAILKNGAIKPLDPIPADWVDGQELVVEESAATPTERELREWDQEIEALGASGPPRATPAVPRRYCGARMEGQGGRSP